MYDSGQGIWGGVAFGLLFGSIMAFFIRGATRSATFREKEAFISQLNIALAEIGYHPQSCVNDLLMYKPSLQAGLLAGKIAVQMEDGRCTIVGPRIYVAKLRKRLSRCATGV